MVVVVDSLINSALEHGTLEKRFYDEFDDAEHLRIVVCGVGGAGNNTLNRLQRIGIEGADLLAVNTDKQDLNKLQGNITKVLIGSKLMRGLGTGGFPELGEKAAESSRHELGDVLSKTHLLFVSAGMGGGTGTGATPVISAIAKDKGLIVVAIVTYPFNMERARLDKARKGIEKLRKVADTVIVIDNNKLVEYVPNLPLDKAFSVADEVVARALKGITETILETSLINLDFADIKSVLGGGNVAVISVGEGEGPGRVEEAVNNTMSHPLLDVDYSSAEGALIDITGGEDLSLGDANTVGELITNKLGPSASVTWGARINPELEGKIQVITIVTGVNSPNILGSDKTESSSFTQDKEEWDVKSV